MNGYQVYDYHLEMCTYGIHARMRRIYANVSNPNILTWMIRDQLLDSTIMERSILLLRSTNNIVIFFERTEDWLGVASKFAELSKTPSPWIFD